MRRRGTRYFVLFCLLLVAGIVWEAIMERNEKSNYPPIGEYVDLGSYQAHYYSKGEGETVFVFITGSGTPCAYTDFYGLQKQLSKYGQTITFDHAGSGWSKTTKEPRKIANLVEELSILIDKVAGEKKVVLVCHSLGSLEAIGYAQKYPERMSGMIFLDSGTPQFYSTDSELKAIVMNRGFACIRAIGLNRLLTGIGVYLPLYGENVRHSKLEGEVRTIDQAMYYRFVGNTKTLDTVRWMNENAKTILRGPSLGELPILVLSSDSGKEWKAVQTELAGWSKNSKQSTIRKAGHYLHWTNDKEVIKQIEEFIKTSII